MNEEALNNPQKVMVIEDDSAIAMVMNNKLLRKGYDVVVISDGAEAIRRIPEEMPDIIYLDLILPTQDGVSVLKNIRSDEKTKDIPVVVLSNLGQEEDIKRVKKYKVADYLIKSNISIDNAVKDLEHYLKKQDPE